ncbi:MAG: hypothetical protein ABJL11_15415 [Parasphingorhabdus sp.]
MKRAVLVSAVAVTLTVAPFPQLAAPAKASDATHICMSKMTNGSPGGDNLFTIVVRKSERSAFKAKSFQKTGCKGRMVKFARVAPRSLQRNFKQTHGATPTRLCRAMK